MTLEEQIAELQAKLAAEQKKVADQNRYITSLEAKAASQGSGKQGELSEGTKKMIYSLVKEKEIDKASAVIIADYGQEVFTIMYKEFEDFLNANMSVEDTTQSYIVDAFSFVYGKAFRNKSHPIHTLVGKGKDSTPTVTPTNPAVVGSNADEIQRLQRQVAGGQPGITPKDGGAPGAIPNQQRLMKDTKDSFSVLKDKLSGGNRFS
jgi:hypothetical protein